MSGNSLWPEPQLPARSETCDTLSRSRHCPLTLSWPCKRANADETRTSWKKDRARPETFVRLFARSGTPNNASASTSRPDSTVIRRPPGSPSTASYGPKSSCRPAGALAAQNLIRADEESAVLRIAREGQVSTQPRSERLSSQPPFLMRIAEDECKMAFVSATATRSLSDTNEAQGLVLARRHLG
jgi:hypothetical protein